jgi:muconate/chloromuconate cycloisomerase
VKIAAVEIQSTRIPSVRAHQMAIGTTHFQENVIVKMIADDGTVGYGEAPHMVGHSQLGETPHTVRVILRHKLVPAILGMNPFEQEALTVALARAVPGNDRAKGALVLAAYDLAAKALDTPLYNLLGGKVRDRIPLSWSLPIVEIDKVVEEGIQMVERGWRILKVKVGRSDPSEDVEAVRALREAVGDDISIRADANQAYDIKTAHRVLREMEPYRVDFMEQPVHRDDLEGMAEVTRQSPIPIMADEAAKSPEALAAIIRHRAADYVSIYVIGPGGLLKSKKMAALAEAFRMRAYVGGALESVIGAASGLHFAASSPAVDLGCEMSGQYLLKDDFGTEPLRMEDGAFVVPSGPGLGVELDEAKLEQYREGEVERIQA